MPQRKSNSNETADSFICQQAKQFRYIHFPMGNQKKKQDDEFLQIFMLKVDLRFSSLPRKETQLQLTNNSNV